MIVVWPDADWNGDPHTTRSTSGLFVELCGTKSGNCFPLTWKVSHQTATSSSSAESETVSASVAIRGVALPVQMLLKDMLGTVVPILCKIDNTQAIQAIKNGYSKKLRYLPRTQRVSIGALNEIWRDPAVAMEVESLVQNTRGTSSRRSSGRRCLRKHGKGSECVAEWSEKPKMEQL